MLSSLSGQYSRIYFLNNATSFKGPMKNEYNLTENYFFQHKKNNDKKCHSYILIHYCVFESSHVTGNGATT